MPTFKPKVEIQFLEHARMRSVHIWERQTARRIFTDVERAASFLMVGWPREFQDTSRHRAAQVAALVAINGGPAADFREAFIDAASEAGILAEPTLALSRRNVA